MSFRKQTASAAGTALALFSKPKELAATANLTNEKSAFEGFQGDGAVLVGKGTRIVGQISDSTLVEIQGVLEGDVIASRVIVREGACFRGNMHTARAEVHGLIEGSLVAEELLEIHSTGRVGADVKYGQLSVETGGHLNGTIATQDTVELDAKHDVASSEVLPSANAENPRASHPQFIPTHCSSFPDTRGRRGR